MLFLPAWISRTKAPIFNRRAILSENMCSKMYWKLSVHIERIPYCAVSVHQETRGLRLPTAFPKENPRALLYGWKDTGELAVMWLYRMASLSALPGLKTGTLQAG